MKIFSLSVASLLSVVFLGAGCLSAPPVTNAPRENAPANVPAPQAEQGSVRTTILVSSADSLNYCNGADMDSDGYRKTITVEKPVTVPSNQTPAAYAKSILIAATTSMCQEVIERSDITVVNGELRIPPFGAWAGVSITMCSCRPEIEVNALRIPGIQKVVWDAAL